MKKLKTAVVGMGYIGASHIDALRRIPECELYAVMDVHLDLARAKASLYGVPRVFDSVEAMLACPEIDVVHDCTPTDLHTQINQQVLKAGKHLLSEKPLATTYEDALACVAAGRTHPECVSGVNFNYRLNPLVQEMRARVRSGEVGEILAVTGCYLQDWLLYETDYSWRLEPSRNGVSCAVADIGSHWMDAVQHVTGLRITEVCADLRTALPVRKKPVAQTETFSEARGAQTEDVAVESEDYASVLFHLSNGASGSFTAAEVCAGHGCYFQIELSGAKESLMWNQEQNDRLWVGRRNGDNSLIIRDPLTLSPDARRYTSLAKGHPEGWNDAFCGNLRAYYQYLTGDRANSPVFATLEEAARVVRLTEACVESAHKRGWVAVS